MTEKTLQNSIRVLNDFCSDTEAFSYHSLAHLVLDNLGLHIDAEKQEISLIISTVENYQTLLHQLNPSKRLHQLLSLHFQKAHLFFGTEGESVEKGIFLDTIMLGKGVEFLEVRNPEALGARLRRALNIALQGHIGVLRLTDERDISSLRAIWQRGRVTQLLNGYGIVAFDDDKGLVKLWKPRRLEEGEQPIVIIA